MVSRSILTTGRSLSAPGLMLAAVFFASSLTPSLIPRDYLPQGILSGIAFAAGYLAGVGLDQLWTYLELPEPRDGPRRLLVPVALAICVALCVGFLWQASAWQNGVRTAMRMEPVHSARPFEVAGIAAVVFALLLALARMIKLVFRTISGRLRRHVPRRVANVVGVVIVGSLVWMAVDGLLFRAILRVADSSFRGLDELVEVDVPRPEDPARTGSPASLIDWAGLGRQGRSFVATGPSAGDIEAMTQEPAIEPIRVYAGLNSADTAEERAALALAEMKRVGAFDRPVLVIVTPTGTGWVDPAALDTLEYLHHGNVASVAIQYSYLASWLSLLVEPGYGAEASKALFRAVYGYWTTLPKDRRPRLYLHGLSLGAMNSDLSTDLYDVLGDPFQGALWSGPPFPSRTWNMVTAGRNAGTPAWLPTFRDGSLVRFANQHGWAGAAAAPWGPIRIVYLQYASDPIVFFDTRAGFREPAWMKPPRGPDVSPSLVWFPVVTQLQLILDIALATTTPMGFGHVYAAEDYVDPWVQVTQPPGWTPEALANLKAALRAQRGVP
jgi:uncharacterized membrane protein